MAVGPMMHNLPYRPSTWAVRLFHVCGISTVDRFLQLLKESRDFLDPTLYIRH